MSNDSAPLFITKPVKCVQVDRVEKERERERRRDREGEEKIDFSFRKQVFRCVVEL